MSGYYLRDSGDETAAALEADLLDAETADSITIPAIGASVTVTNLNNGEAFDIGSVWLGAHVADAHNYNFEGRVSAVSGTSVIFLCQRAENAGSAKTGWSFTRTAPPQPDLPLLSITGLLVSGSGANITITSGSVMDSTGAVLLTLENNLVKRVDLDWTAGTGGGAMQRVALTGTVSNSGTTLNGTGTLFTSQLTTGNTMADLVTQGSSSSDPSYVSNLAGSSSHISTITNNTTATVADSITFAAESIYRGSLSSVTLNRAAGGVCCLIRKDSDGSIDACISSFTAAGTPDIPSGYTLSRILAEIGITGTGASRSYSIVQPLYVIVLPHAPDDESYLVWNSSHPYLANALSLGSSTSNIPSQTGSTVSIQRAALTGDVTASQNSNATTIANDAVSNAKLANMGAYSLKMNNTGSSADPTDTAITALTEKTSIHNDDLLLLVDSEASNVMKKAKKSNVGGIGMGKAIAAAIVFG